MKVLFKEQKKKTHSMIDEHKIKHDNGERIDWIKWKRIEQMEKKWEVHVKASKSTKEASRQGCAPEEEGS